MQENTFNLVSAWQLLQKQWKTIALFVAITVAAATITVFCVPQYFRSKALIVPASTVLADKARLFNTNIQSLYSYFGNGDDMDRIYGVGAMDTTYKTLVDSFALVNYYGLEGNDVAVLKAKAVLKLQKDLVVQKTENGQLEIIAWTKNKQLSADLVNTMVQIIQQREGDIWQKVYQRSLSTLETSAKKMELEYEQLGDSLTKTKPPVHDLLAAKMEILLEQVKTFRKTANEYKLALSSPADVLFVMEHAVPAARAERPDKRAVILAAFIIGTVFSCLLVLLRNRKNIA